MSNFHLQVGCDTRNKEQKFLGFDTKQKLTKEIWPKETKKTKQFVRLFSWPIFEAICLKYSPISTPKGQFKQSESKLGKFELIFAPNNFAPHTGWSIPWQNLWIARKIFVVILSQTEKFGEEERCVPYP